jgi:hypothetical protein
MNGMGHYLDSVNSAGYLSRRSRRAKRTSWRGPILALLAVGVLVLRSVL